MRDAVGALAPVARASVVFGARGTHAAAVPAFAGHGSGVGLERLDQISVSGGGPSM
jgi:hypothetical protein